MAPSFIWFIFILCTLSFCKCFILPSLEDIQNNNFKDWSEAELHCRDKHGTHLVSIHSEDVFEEIRNAIVTFENTLGTFDDIQNAAPSVSEHSFWIGLSLYTEQTDTRPTPSWSDHTPFDFGNAMNGEYPWFEERPESIGMYSTLPIFEC